MLTSLLFIRSRRPLRRSNYIWFVWSSRYSDAPVVTYLSLTVSFRYRAFLSISRKLTVVKLVIKINILFFSYLTKYSRDKLFLKSVIITQHFSIIIALQIRLSFDSKRIFPALEGILIFVIFSYRYDKEI